MSWLLFPQQRQYNRRTLNTYFTLWYVTGILLSILIPNSSSAFLNFSSNLSDSILIATTSDSAYGILHNTMKCLLHSFECLAWLKVINILSAVWNFSKINNFTLWPLIMAPCWRRTKAISPSGRTIISATCTWRKYFPLFLLGCY